MVGCSNGPHYSLPPFKLHTPHIPIYSSRFLTMNQAQLIWNMTKDPEVRETPNGNKVATFSVATNYRYKDAAWIKQEQVEFHNIVAWNTLAEIVEKYCWKGKKIFIQGRMTTRTWDAEDWTKRYRHEIIAESIEMLGGGKRDDSDQWSAPDESQVPPKTKKEKNTRSNDDGVTIEDIPF